MCAAIPEEPDAELRRAVCLSHDISYAFNLPLYDAWFAARAVALEMRPDLDETEIGGRVAMIIAWKEAQDDLSLSWKGIAA
ncbi:hypothetical protein N825_28925 [Skermanella stibiiresistens SB22]|uniref:Uncharacterized protein n=1 Tax=Skermanella stibiiresistens SB22 TaxID=1385369 RepID=W9GXU2_9PROT|nr:hypothetical protein [Skermanella stibiiresistens]EWY36298.1 hypothetical protein N825_28925 [Skermanella stibiiresistens SB22]